MLKKSSYFIFFPSLVIGTLMVCSSSSWFMAWMGLEINLMSFIPILLNKLTIKKIELSIKYFLIQSMASLILIFIFLISLNNINLSMMWTNEVILLALVAKAGLAPLHFWFPQVMKNCNWSQSILILTWQKIAPFMMISYLNNFFILFVIMTSAIIGVISGINQTSINLILTYSSIIHSSWLLSIMMVSESYWILYFLIYSFLLMMIIFFFKKINILNINDFQFINLNSSTKILMFINLLSIAGLPPFIGFFIKFISMIFLVSNKFYIFIIIILISSSLISFYFYSRMIFSSLFISKINNKNYFLTFYNLNLNLLLMLLLVMSLSSGLFLMKMVMF